MTYLVAAAIVWMLLATFFFCLFSMKRRDDHPFEQKLDFGDNQLAPAKTKRAFAASKSVGVCVASNRVM